MRPNISLVTPCYNAARYLRHAINSVADQTLPTDFFEWIICDDASIDNSWAIVQDATSNMPNVTLLHNEVNGGISYSKNRAIEIAKADLISVLDADDFLHPKALESALSFHAWNPNVKYSYSNYARVGETGQNPVEMKSHEYSERDLLRFNFVTHLRTFSKEVHEKIGGFDSNSLVEDWDHVLKASEVVSPGQIVHNPELLYFYRINDEGISLSKTKQVRESSCETLTKALARRGIKAKVEFDKKNRFDHTYYKHTIVEN